MWRRGRWWAVDLRYCGMGRPTMRDPRHPHWPEAGERTEVEEVAKRWRWAYADLARARHLERVIDRKPVLRLGAAVEAYKAHRERVVEPRTFAGDRTVLRHLTDFYPASTELHGLDLQRLVRSLLDREYKASTVSQYVTSLKGLWRFHDLPFPSVTVPKADTPDVRYWTDAEVERLREAATGDVLRALDLTLYMGLRVGEVFALRWSDIDAGAWTVRVTRQIPQGRSSPKPLKGKRARTALILPGWTHTGAEGLVVHRDGQPVGRRVQWRWIRDLLDRTGLNRVGAGWHMGRHTYARLCLEGGASLEQLQKFLGHASIRTTEDSYGWLRPDVAVEQAKRRLHGR